MPEADAWAGIPGLGCVSWYFAIAVAIAVGVLGTRAVDPLALKPPSKLSHVHSLMSDINVLWFAEARHRRCI